MKGGFSVAGDYVYFKSQVPLHKIPVSSVFAPLFLIRLVNFYLIFRYGFGVLMMGFCLF